MVFILYNLKLKTRVETDPNKKKTLMTKKHIILYYLFPEFLAY